MQQIELDKTEQKQGAVIIFLTQKVVEDSAEIKEQYIKKVIELTINVLSETPESKVFELGSDILVNNYIYDKIKGEL